LACPGADGACCRGKAAALLQERPCRRQGRRINGRDEAQRCVRKIKEPSSITASPGGLSPRLRRRIHILLDARSDPNSVLRTRIQACDLTQGKRTCVSAVCASGDVDETGDDGDPRPASRSTSAQLQCTMAATRWTTQKRDKGGGGGSGVIQPAVGGGALRAYARTRVRRKQQFKSAVMSDITRTRTTAGTARQSVSDRRSVVGRW
jgi:hypothetical protein